MYLGIEIGGTKLQLGIGPGDGALHGLWRDRVDVAAGPEGIRAQIVRAVPELLAKCSMQRSELGGVGIGFGGPVDDASRTIIKSHQISGWDDFPLAEWISEAVELPVTLGNDADVAGLAETLFGAGEGLSPVFYITVGSGIGGGLIIEGAIQRGCGRGAAEIGHLRVAVSTPQGMRFRPLEEIASGWSIERAARAEEVRARHQGATVFGHGDDPERLTCRLVAERADQGNQVALMVLQGALERLAEAICHVIALVCPRRIVIGGGVSLIGERMFFVPLRELVGERVFRPFAGCCDIVPARLGEEVVVHGALALARQRLSASPG
jgi:glucokinase